MIKSVADYKIFTTFSKHLFSKSKLRVSKKSPAPPSGLKPDPSPFLDGPGHGPQFRPYPARRAGSPVGPPLKKNIYIYKKYIQEIENATLIKIFIANYFIH